MLVLLLLLSVSLFLTWTFSSRSVARQLTSEATAGTSVPVTTTVDVTTPVKPAPPGGVSVNGGVTPPVGAFPLERLDNLIKVQIFVYWSKGKFGSFQLY